MAASPPKELLDLLKDYEPGIQEITLQLRQLVIEELAPCSEYILEVYIISLVYGSTERMKDWSTLIFENGKARRLASEE